MAFSRSAIKDAYIKVGTKSVKVSDATDAQLKAAAIANPNILASGYSISGGNVVKAGAASGTMTQGATVTGSAASQQAAAQAAQAAATRAEQEDATRRAASEEQRRTEEAKRIVQFQQTNPGVPVPTFDLPNSPIAAPAPIWDPAMLANDPDYKREKGDLDYSQKLAKGNYDEKMGVDGAKGSIWQDWESAMEALGRDSRKNISSANAGLSGANLSGSGIARKSLSDIGAAFLAESSRGETQRNRDLSRETRTWLDFMTNYNTSDLALKEQGAARWRVNQEGRDPGVLDFPKPKASKPTTVQGHKVVGGQVQNINRPGSPVQDVPKGTPAPRPYVRPGAGRAVTGTFGASAPKTWKHADGSIRQIGTGKIIKAAPRR